MNSEDIYQKVLLDHYKHPRHFRTIPDSEAHVDVYNPLCGDRIRIHLNTDNGVLESVWFDGNGCAISIAYTSLMIENINKNIQIADAIKRADRVIKAFSSGKESTSPELEPLDPINVVTRFPMRIKCATLGWLALKKALEKL